MPGLLDCVLQGRGGGRTAAASSLRAAVIGICKNAGKTVAFNHLVTEAAGRGLRLALVSSGRDGEAKDAITNLAKPAIHAPAGTWLATARGALTPVVAELQELPLTTPLGPVVLGRARAAGEVVLVSPGSKQRLETALAALESVARAAGDPPALTLVDGAFDRLAAAAPDLVDTVVLAVGAAYSPSLRQTLAQAAFLLDVLRLPPASQDPAMPGAAVAAGEPALLLPGDTVPRPLGVASALLDAPALLAAAAAFVANASEARATLVLPGALGDGLLQAWLEHFPRLAQRLGIVLPDATHVLAGRELWRRWRQLGGAAAVWRPIRVAAVTANAYSPVGTSYDAGNLFAGICRAAAGLPVFDLVQGLQCN